MESGPETDTVIWLQGGILVLWPIALAWIIHEYVNVEDKKKHWMVFNITGFLLMTSVPLGWEVYFLYGFAVAVAVTITQIWNEK